MPTREEFDAQIKEAIGGRLDPEYIGVKLSAAVFDAFGEEVTLTLEGSEPLTGALAKQVADQMVQSAPEALRTIDFDAVRKKAAEMNRQGELTEAGKRVRAKLYAGGVVDNPNGTSDVVARRIGL